MPEFFSETYYGNTVSQWAIALLIILGSAVVGKLIYWFLGKTVKALTAKTKTKLDDILVDMLEEPIVFGIIIFGMWLGLGKLELTPGAELWVSKVIHILIAINVTWMIARLVDALILEYIVPLTEKTESDLDDQLMPVARKGLRTIIWILGIIIALNNAGYDITAMIAGLGIGGLALAMAAQDTVKNFFGGFMIFTDKPFKINDRVQVDGFDGTIMEIGLRSTRLRTLDGRVVVIPNSKFTDNAIENVSLEPTRKIVTNLGLVYDTTPEQMQQAMDILKEIAAAHQDKIEENTPIGFNNFGDFALGIIFIYYIRKEADILQTQTDINLDILTKFNGAGLNMAFPTQTIYNVHENSITAKA